VSWFLTGPFLYAAAAILAVGSAVKIVALARLPRHVRWELYPLPRLGKAGSKYQKVNFADQPPHHERLPEIAFMAGEILLFRKAYAGRRDLWFGSLLLHAGLYLGIALLALLAAGAILSLMAAEGLSAVVILDRLAAAIAPLAMAAGLAGAVYLVALRLVDGGLRAMSDTVTFFNLIFLATLFGVGLAAWSLSDVAAAQARSHLASLLRGRPADVEGGWLAAAMVLFGLFAAYLPFSRMFHFAAKYFFYHQVLWDNEAMIAGSRMERGVAASLEYHPSWSAEHVRRGASWREQVSAERDEGDRPHDA